MSYLTVSLNDGTRMPWLAYGTGTVHRDKDTSAITTLAINHGMAHLDGAQMYKNEEWLGKAIADSKKKRHELYVTTKLDEVPEGKTTRDALIESLAKLRLAYVDLFLIHAPIHHPGRLGSVWQDLEALQQEGLARSIGVSNFTVKQLEEVMEVATVTPAVNQVQIFMIYY